MKIPAEQAIKNLFGKSAQELDFTLINFNSMPQLGLNGEESHRTPTCAEYIMHCMDIYPNIARAYKDRTEKQTNIDTMVIADETFVPMWISPSSTKKLTHPKPFGGDHRTETEFNKIGAYSTNQSFAKYTNGNFCAALASKMKFDSSKTNLSDPVVSPIHVGKTEIEYVMERGIVNNIGEKSSDILRYISLYEKSNGKLGVSLISGDYDFVMGYVNITRRIIEHTNALRDFVKNKDQYKGIHLSRVEVGNVGNSDPEKEHSIALTRLLAGSILVSDHLTVLKNVYNVTHICQFDLARSEELITVPIDDVINSYHPIKKYVAMTMTLNSIK